MNDFSKQLIDTLPTLAQDDLSNLHLLADNYIGDMVGTEISQWLKQIIAAERTRRESTDEFHFPTLGYQEWNAEELWANLWYVHGITRTSTQCLSAHAHDKTLGRGSWTMKPLKPLNGRERVGFQQAADEIGIHRTTLFVWIASEKFPRPRRLAGRCFWFQDEFDAAVENLVQQSESHDEKPERVS